MKAFWFVLKDDDNMTFDFIGPISDDIALTNVVADKQKAGFHIRCETPWLDRYPDMNSVINVMECIGYKQEVGLFERIGITT